MTTKSEKNGQLLENLRQKIQARRLELGFSLEEMEKKTKISKNYLKSIEENGLQTLGLAWIYQKKILKKYADSLGLNADKSLTKLEPEKDKNEQTVHFEKKRIGFQNIPSFLRSFIALAVAGTVFIYLGVQIQNILKPPGLTIYSPQNGQITGESVASFYGETEPEVQISINGKVVKNNENGKFNETIGLSPGINSFVIVAQKKYGKTTSETRYVIKSQKSIK